MTGTPENDTLLRLLHQAFDDQPIPPGPHFVEDQQFLARWSLGTLQLQERVSMIEHLGECPICRLALGCMLEDGALDLPPDTAFAGDLLEDAPRQQPSVTPERDEAPVVPSNNRRAWIAVLATAAGLLVAVAVWFGRFSDARFSRSVALTEFKYHLNGIRYAKKSPDLTEAQKRRWAQLQAAIQDQRADVRVRLEYGYLLLGIGDPRKDFAEAARQFKAVLDNEPTSLEALNGLGIALFRQNRAEEALLQFRAAAAARPDDLAVQLNIAICLEFLGRSSEATPHFETVLRRTRDSSLQRRIQEYLQSRGKTP